MPTYDYRCSACGHALEIFHGITEKPRKTCPRCKKPKLERLISAGAGLLFKGSGFYQTDYRSQSYKAGEKQADAANAPAPEKTSEKTGVEAPKAEAPQAAAPAESAAVAKPAGKKSPKSGDKPKH